MSNLIKMPLHEDLIACEGKLFGAGNALTAYATYAMFTGDIKIDTEGGLHSKG